MKAAWPSMFKPPQGLTQDDMRGVNEIFVGTKGYLGTSDRGESYTLLPRSRQAGHPRPPEVLEAFARTLPGLDSGLQRRPARVFQFHHRRPLHRMDAVGRDKLAIPQREAAVGRQEPALHQQREGQRVHQAQLPQGLGASGRHGLTHMSDDTGIAIEESPPVVEVPPPQRRRKKQPADAKPKQQPPYAVVLFNDEDHTFQYVVETLMKVFGYPKRRATRSRCKSTTRARAWCGRAAARWPNSNATRFAPPAPISTRRKRWTFLSRRPSNQCRAEGQASRTIQGRVGEARQPVRRARNVNRFSGRRMLMTCSPPWQPTGFWRRDPVKRCVTRTGFFGNKGSWVNRARPQYGISRFWFAPRTLRFMNNPG